MDTPTQSTSGGGGSPEFGLPEGIMAVMPTDPFEVLDIARKLTSFAITSRVSKLELENGKLRQSVKAKDAAIGELQEKLDQLDRMFQQADARLRTALEENVKIAKERDLQAHTSKKLAGELDKLKTFKKQLMKSLTEDGLPPSSSLPSYLQRQQDTHEITMHGQSIAQESSFKDLSIACSAPTVNTSTDSRNITKDVTRLAVQKVSKTPPIPRATLPTVTPQTTSTVGSPKGFSAAVSPRVASGATSPTKISYDGLTSMSPWLPSSKQSSAANSPPCGRNQPGRPRVDGKEFFRMARNRLSYEQFGAFLANIKELNAHKQTREEAVKKVEEIFGPDNRDLFAYFRGLLLRNMA